MKAQQVHHIMTRVIAVRGMPLLAAIVALHALWTEATEQMATMDPWRGWTLLLEFIHQELDRLYDWDTQHRARQREAKEKNDRFFVFEDWEIPNDCNPDLRCLPPSRRPEAELQTLLAAQAAMDNSTRPRCVYENYQGFCTSGDCCLHGQQSAPEERPNGQPTRASSSIPSATGTSASASVEHSTTDANVPHRASTTATPTEEELEVEVQSDWD